MKADKDYIIPNNTWVYAKRSGRLRYVTRQTNKDCFEDDGKVSGQEPNTMCHYENYKAIDNLKEYISKNFHIVERDGFKFHFMKYPEEKLNTIQDNEKFIEALAEVNSQKMWEAFSNTGEGLMSRIDKDIFKINIPSLPYGSAKARRIEAGVKELQYSRENINTIIKKRL